MGKLSAGFDLGKEPRTGRKTAGLAERIVRALDQGSGTLETREAALNVRTRWKRLIPF